MGIAASLKERSVLKLDDFEGFNPDLASLIEAAREPQLTEVARDGDTGARRYAEIASVSHEFRGGVAR